MACWPTTVEYITAAVEKLLKQTIHFCQFLCKIFNLTKALERLEKEQIQIELAKIYRKTEKFPIEEDPALVLLLPQIINYSSTFEESDGKLALRKVFSPVHFRIIIFN